MMTPKEFADQMRHIFADIDKEHAHMLADDLMCTLLIQLGYPAGVRVFRDADKWYS
jgi:hypothetical protein